MNREDCTVGMKVEFGRHGGEKTLGVVVKVNAKKAKVETLEARGRDGRSAVGTVWNVPYSLMEPAWTTADDEPVRSVTPPPQAYPRVQPADDPIVFNPWGDSAEEYILLAICRTYASLSPENLTCDGELPRHMVAARAAQYRRRLDGLFAALGRRVTEQAADRWFAAWEEHNNRAAARA